MGEDESVLILERRIEGSGAVLQLRIAQKEIAVREDRGIGTLDWFLVDPASGLRAGVDPTTALAIILHEKGKGS
ncbi:MAG: hypothetical protein ACYS76_16775 [Planctomycetota bacterium]|jgi:hypothetical protein